MTVREVDSWKQHGVTRLKEFLVCPHGSLNARVACHLHCPSFSVKDPYRCNTVDAWNVSVGQLVEAGFMPESRLFYDQLHRREALSGFDHYPADILEIREGFTLELWDHMTATVDVCECDLRCELSL